LKLLTDFFFGLLLLIPPWPAVPHAEREAATCYMEEALHKKRLATKSSIEADIGQEGQN
jgi:hypothetical protein